MIHTRAYLLLEKEYKDYEEAKVFGIYISPVEDSLLEWLAEIKGLKDTLWEGAELQLLLKFNEHYHSAPPSVNFTTIPFHPNVDPVTGKPCLDFLDDPNKWSPDLTMLSILLSIQVLLSNPVLTNPVNVEAAKMLWNNYPMYREKVIECVKASQHLEDLQSVHVPPFKYFYRSDESVDFMRFITAISYEDYYLTWTKMATSKTEHAGGSVFEDPDFIAHSYDWLASNVEKDEWNQNMYNFVTEFIVMQKKQQILSHDRMAHRALIQTPESTSHFSFEKRFKHPSKHAEQQEEPWEKEAEELVLWSTNLDEGTWD